MSTVTMLVTDITNVGDERCIAGWDMTRRCMVRPEPSPGGFWPSPCVRSGAAFEIGSIASFKIASHAPETRYPHRTEDRIVNGQIIRLRAPDISSSVQILRFIASPHIQYAFNNKIQVANERAFVPLDTKCPSLGGINARVSDIALIEDVIEGKKRLRCRLKIGNAVAYPSVTATDIRHTYATKGFGAVRHSVERHSLLHIRLGLSRLFTGIHARCYLQVNGIYGIG